MGSLKRLDVISPALSDLFRKGTDTQRNQAMFVACRIAITDAKLSGARIDAALELLMTGATNDGMAREMNALEIEFDDQYFSLSDDDETITPEAQVFFHKARAAAALAYALSPDRSEQNEGLYEAISASNDTDKTIEIVKESFSDRMNDGSQ